MQTVLVKYDLSEAIKNKNKNIDIIREFYDKKFAIISGTIKQMPGHVLCICLDTGKPYILHPESLIELTEDEL